MKIGIVDLDTSHPQNWIPIERELGHEVVGVWDGGSVHTKEYVAQFAQERGIPRVYESLTDLADDADAAIIHGCDWDTHIEKARPFIARGKGVLLDKPMAGNAADIRTLAAWVAQGARITGGSSLRFCVEAAEWIGRPIEERGTPHMALCGCAVDEFNYGIHAYALLSALMGTGAVSVRHLPWPAGAAGETPAVQATITDPQHRQRRVLVTWPDGRSGIVVVGAAASYHPFHATVVTDRTVTHLQPDSGKLYRALLETVLPWLAGDAPEPMSFRDLIEPEMIALAALRSWTEGDREVALTDQDGPGYDGAAFAIGYRQMRYPVPASQ
jgi:predicted dehydrogenase